MEILASENRNRRKHRRFTVSLPLEYQALCDSRMRTGLLANLSSEGVLFLCRDNMSVGTILSMTVMFPDDFALNSFEVRAKIIWKALHFDSDWREYKYGAEFLYISRDDKEKLNRILSTCLFGGALVCQEMFL
jgi:hypothetical protein